MLLNKKNYRIESFKRFNLFIIIGLSLIMQMPIIKDMFYSQIRSFLYIILGIFSTLALLNIDKYLKYPLVKYFLVTIMYSFILYLIVTVSNSPRYFNLFELLIPFGILLSSLNTNFKEKQLSKLLLWYLILSLLIAISSVFYYGDGFTISMTYFLQGKNQVGTLLGISAIITGFSISNNELLGFNSKIIKYAILLTLLSSLLVIRNRAGVLGVTVVLLLLFIKDYNFKIKPKKIMTLILITSMFYILLSQGIFDSTFEFIWNSLFLNFDVTNLDSLSAGRTDTYIQALKYSTRYSFIGELGLTKFFYGTPHNYILYNWVRYGIVMSLPLIAFYGYCWFFSLKNTVFLKGTLKESNQIAPWVLLFSLIVSMFEYSYPYGPGVSQIMLWILLGQYLKNETLHKE